MISKRTALLEPFVASYGEPNGHLKTAALDVGGRCNCAFDEEGR